MLNNCTTVREQQSYNMDIKTFLKEHPRDIHETIHNKIVTNLKKKICGNSCQGFLKRIQKFEQKFLVTVQ